MNKINLNNLQAPAVFKRKNIKRENHRAFNLETAQRAIGPLEKGCDIFGFNKGQFSKIDIIEHCLNQTGPADVSICTWSASSGDIQKAQTFLYNNSIKSLRFIVDFSFKARKPEFLDELIECFGADAVRLTVVHSKFVVIRNENWNIVIRTSMNLNHNPRFENFEITDSKEFADFFDEITDEIWARSEVSTRLDSVVKNAQKNFRQTSFLGLDKDNIKDLDKGVLLKCQ